MNDKQNKSLHITHLNFQDSQWQEVDQKVQT